MNNPHISAKKKYGILTKLIKSQKVSSIPPLIENNKTIANPKQRSELLNKHFANKSTLPGLTDAPPILDKIEVMSDWSKINTSPIELSKIIRSMTKSNQSSCGVPGFFF